ncbi:MAG: D-2-hydroxyacid dehydrogenase [Gemmatimonadaceae bacterium]
MTESALSVPGRRVLVVDAWANAPRWRITPDAERAIRDAAPPEWDVRVMQAPTVSDGDGGTPPSGEALAAIADAEVYVGFGISRPLFEAAGRLRWVHSAAAGVGSALFPAMRESDVILTNSAGVHAVPIAEHVLAGVLFLVRALDQMVELQRARHWDRERFAGAPSVVREMSDCRALIIGAGGLGGAIASRFTALGARCIGVRRNPARGPPAGFERVVGPDEWRALLADCDVLVLAAPATEETRALVGAAELDALPRGAIVVNVSRGTLLDEDGLAERVRRGALRGAVLDVFRVEPLPDASPLWALPSVVISPHVSGVSLNGFWRRELALFLENWRRYQRGELMQNVVDKDAGY